MEDSWIYVDDDDDDDSSYCYLTDSDKIDSDTEAELYSKIHHDNLPCTISENLNEEHSDCLAYLPCDNISYVDREKNASTPIRSTSEHLHQITCDNLSSKKRKSLEMDSNCKKSKQKKHKSDSVTDIPVVKLDSENIKDSPQFKSNNNEDEVIFVSNSNNKSNKKFDTVVIDSSDSDSDFWRESSFVEKDDVKINLLENTDPVFLNTDSDDEPEISSSFVKRNSFLKNLSMPSLKMDENTEGLWHINFEDLHRSKRYSRRYHENIEVTCSNCNRKGHTFRSCPSPRVIKCFFCGGNHIGSRCLSRMCSNCNGYGHDIKNCWQKMNKMVCQLCSMNGHTKGDCPDLWRRYHLTTEPLNPLKKAKKQVQQDTNIYCWNCGNCGHFGSICPSLHLSRSSFSTWPCVISYKNPMKILKSDRLPLIRKFPHLSLAKQNSRFQNISCTTGKQDIHLKSRNELNVSSGSNEENRENKGKKKNLRRTDLRFNKVHDIVKEKDFPRTTKKKSPKKPAKILDKSVNKPASVKIKEETNKLINQWINNRKTSGLQISHLDSQIIQDDLEMNFEDLPGFVKLVAKKRFQSWKKRMLNKLKKKKRKQNKSKGRELTN